MDLLIQIIVVVVLGFVGLIFGSKREKEHYEVILRREKNLLNLSVRADQTMPTQVKEAQIVYGSVVVANDYFKALVGNLKNFFGGRLTSYESLMDRARREATLRMKEKALAWGADEIVHYRIETSFLDKLGVEVFSFGTAIKK